MRALLKGPLVLLSGCVERYLEDCYGLAAGTRGLYEYHLRRFVEAGDLSVRRVSPAVVRSYLASLKRRDGKPYSPYYLDQVYRTLNTFFKWCVREGLVRRNPLDRVRRPRVPRRKSPKLSLEEVERLLEAVKRTAHPVRNLAMVCLAVDSGLRRGEILGLEVGNVDLVGNVVRVLGKGSKERDVPLSVLTCIMLERYLGMRPASESNRVFLTSAGEPMTRNGLQTLMYRLKKKAGLPQLRWHLLRHTFANHYIDAGGGLRRLQKILGHSSIKTTAEIYTDPELEGLKAEHSRCSLLAEIENDSYGS